LVVCAALVRHDAQYELMARTRAAGASLIEMDERAFRKAAYRDNPDGWLGTFRMPRRRLDEVRLGATPFLVVAEAVEKPGNLGALLRTADAAGVDAVISCEPHTDWGNPNVVRASKGTLFTVPTAEAETQPAIAWLRRHGTKIVVATPDARAVYSDEDLRGPVAIVVGTERHGVSRVWLDAADVAVAIPMYGRVNSLNVATAAALVIYEVVRQRPAAAPDSPRG
ncbi:MAG: RNA methyltransferase, partial [Chloroflexi bacterium]|nr:RNA methyltransferase [Chloroflexota bacterium]